MLGYIIDNRSDMSTLKETNKELATRYEALRMKASWEIDDNEVTPIRHQLLKERREAVGQIEGSLREIRELEGYEQFRKQPQMDEQRSLATGSFTVVINVTEIRADTIILTYDGIKTLPFQNC